MLIMNLEQVRLATSKSVCGFIRKAHKNQNLKDYLKMLVPRVCMNRLYSAVSDVFFNNYYSLRELMRHHKNHGNFSKTL